MIKGGAVTECIKIHKNLNSNATR